MGEQPEQAGEVGKVVPVDAVCQTPSPEVRCCPLAERSGDEGALAPGEAGAGRSGAHDPARWEAQAARR